MLEGVGIDCHLGLVMDIYSQIQINLLVPFMIKFLLHGREEWNSCSGELGIEFEE